MKIQAAPRIFINDRKGGVNDADAYQSAIRLLCFSLIAARFKPLGSPVGEPSIQYERVAEQDYGVNRLAPAAMFDLMAARKPIGDDRRIGAGRVTVQRGVTFHAARSLLHATSASSPLIVDPFAREQVRA